MTTLTPEKAAVARAVMGLMAQQQRYRGKAPRTDGELQDWIAEITGCRIPRKAVCPDHDAPFELVADLYFGRVTDALALANRGGGKTFDLAALHLANGYWHSPFATSHIGAIDVQGHRCYAYYRAGLRHPALQDQAPDPHIRDTLWRNGSRIEILPGTERQTQGGHPMLVTYDELESGKYQPYENAKAMPAEWMEDGGRRRVGQFLATSTRLSSMGLMQRALDEATSTGMRVYTWCIFETMAPCHTGCFPMGCPIYEWTEGRSLEADGWRSHEDILSHHRRVGQDTWDAQYLCKKPEAKALIYAPFSEANISEEAEFTPGAGQLWVDYDWGFTDPTHISLVQYDDGVFYVFDEIVGTNRSEREWVREIVRRICALRFEEEGGSGREIGYVGPTFEEWEEIWAGKRPWPKPWPQVWPEAVGDPTAVQFRSELKEHGITAARPALVRHNVEEGQDVMRAAILSGSDLRRLIIHPRCKQTIRAITNYRARELADGSFDPHPDPDPANHAFSHGCDGKRYLLWRLRHYLGLGEKGE